MIDCFLCEFMWWQKNKEEDFLKENLKGILKLKHQN